MKRLALVGDVGFVGLELAEYALDRDAAVTLVGEIDAHENDDRPSRLLDRGVEHEPSTPDDPSALDATFDEADAVVVLGTKIGGIGRFHEIPADLLVENTRQYAAIFEAAVASDVDRVVFRSSPMVYQQSDTFPLTEDQTAEIPPPESAYGFQKLTGERYCAAYHDQHDLPFAVVRPFNVVGPGDYPGEEVGNAHVVPDLTKKILGERQHPLKLLGDGRQVRSFVDSRDVARALYRSATREAANGEVLNVGTADGTSIRDLAAMLWDHCDRAEELRFESERSFEHDVQRRVPDLSRAREVLDWEPAYSVEEATGRYVEWYRETVAGASE